MAYKRDRNYTLEKERDLSLTIAPEGTPLPDRVCGGCAHYRAGGSCAERRKDVGYLWTACASFTEKDKVTNVVTNTTNTMEKTTSTTKVCKKCGRELPAEAFNRHAKSRDGLQPYCRECQRETAKAGAAKAGRPKKATEQVEQKPVDLPPGFYFIDLDGNRYYSKEFRYGDMKVKIAEPTPTAANPSVTEIPDHDLAQELRRRGYDVKCSKTIEL